MIKIKNRKFEVFIENLENYFQLFNILISFHLLAFRGKKEGVFFHIRFLFLMDFIQILSGYLFVCLFYLILNKITLKEKYNNIKTY
jgi:hypothetical protein